MFRFIFTAIIVIFGGFFIYENYMTASPKDFRQLSPRLNIQNFFAGHVNASGFTQDWRGKITDQFTIDVDSILRGDKLMINESYNYVQTGNKKSSILITKEDQYNYHAKIKGDSKSYHADSYGNAFHVVYDAKMKIWNYAVDIKTSNWNYLLDNNTILSVSTDLLYGFPISKKTIVYKK